MSSPTMLYRQRHLALFFLLAVLLSACKPGLQAPPEFEAVWSYADLRLMDAADSAEPGSDLVAIYMRSSRRNLQIRLDFLDISSLPNFDLYLVFDTATGGSQSLPVLGESEVEWDTLVVIPASGPIQALEPGGRSRRNLAVWVQRNPVLDTLVIQVNRASLPRTRFGTRLQVFLTRPAGQEIADQAGPARLEDSPPPPANVLFAFWNVFPAYTPAMALRRWDGAHTGPLGGRHGLYNLLRTARNHSIPLVLLDLKTPAGLSALDYAGGLELVQNLAQSGLLILPDVLPAFPSSYPDWILERAVNESRAVAQEFGLPTSEFLFRSSNLAGTRFWNQHYVNLLLSERIDPDTGSLAKPTTVSSIASYGNRTLVIEDSPTEQVDETGLVLAVRESLVEAALVAGQPGQEELPVILGGDLPTSAWGIPQIARLAFAYLSAHPWIRPVSASDMIATLGTSPQSGEALPARATAPRAAALQQNETAPVALPNLSILIESLRSAPPNPLSTAAWQAFLALHSPLSPYPQGLKNLRDIYMGQIASLAAAAGWAENRLPQASCDLDLDGDGKAECLLASETVCAIFETEAGSLSYLFAIEPGLGTADGVHQLIGPSSQIIAGLSDPAGWDLARGLEADPAVIPGAFTGNGTFTPTIQEGRLIFQSIDGSLVKEYSLTQRGIRIAIHSESAQTFQIPLVLDPWQRFFPGWGDRYELEKVQGRDSQSQMNALPGRESWRWEQAGGPAILIHSSAPVRLRTFRDTRQRMGFVEDPNTEFPLGHYLPFPLALAEFEGRGDLWMDIELAAEGS